MVRHSPWDHDACVNNPVSGGVWGDVLRQVAVWHLRVDAKAEVMQRVCKSWQVFWRVALGVFRIDLHARRIPLVLKPFEIHNWREREKLRMIERRFQSGSGKAVPPPSPPMVQLSHFLASC